MDFDTFLAIHQYGAVVPVSSGLLALLAFVVGGSVLGGFLVLYAILAQGRSILLDARYAGSLVVGWYIWCRHRESTGSRRRRSSPREAHERDYTISPWFWRTIGFQSGLLRDWRSYRHL